MPPRTRSPRPRGRRPARRAGRWTRAAGGALAGACVLAACSLGSPGVPAPEPGEQGSASSPTSGAPRSSAPLPTAAGPAAPTPTAAEGEPRLVGTWGTAVVGLRTDLGGRTVRNVLRTGVGGEELRVSLSNAMGARPVVLGASVGLHAGGGALVPGSVRGLTFDGRAEVRVPPGEEVLSDPLPGPWGDQLELAVSVHVDGDPGTVTGHDYAWQTSYVSEPGDRTQDETAGAFGTRTSSWYLVAGVLVTGDPGGATVVALGDSITEGFGSTPGADQRWPDHLARRLLADPDPGRSRTGVVNTGISGNQLLADGAGGPSTLARLERDALDRPGVETVVLLVGVNDLIYGASAEDVVAGYRRLLERTRAAGVCVVAGTLTAYGPGGPDLDAERRAVNAWIRGSGAFDGVVDFDAATRDPQDPGSLLRAHDSGDGLHPGDAGFEAMAAAVDLDALDCDR